MEGAISSLKRSQNASKGFINPVISSPVSAIAAEAPPPPPLPPGSTTFSSSMPSVAFALLAAPPAALLTLCSFLPAASACAKVCPKIEAIKAATARVAFASPCIRAVRAGRTASRMGANAVRRLLLTPSNAVLNSLLCPAAPDIRLFIARKNAYSPAVRKVAFMVLPTVLNRPRMPFVAFCHCFSLSLAACACARFSAAAARSTAAAFFASARSAAATARCRARSSAAATFASAASCLALERSAAAAIFSCARCCACAAFAEAASVSMRKTSCA